MTKPFIDNQQRAEAYLARFKSGPVPHWIDGKADAGSGETFDDLSPVRGRGLAKIAPGPAADIDRAAKAAARAFPAWSKSSGEARKVLLHKIADKIVARA